MIQKLKDGRTDLVFDLLDSGTAATYKDDQGVNLIQWCAYYGDVSAVKYLLGKGASLQDLGDNFDLNGASFHGYWPLCQFLLEQGADAAAALESTGETALHSTLSHPNRPVSNIIIKLLLAYGADPNARTLEGKETGGFMRDAFTKGETPLHRAAAFGNEDTIRMLLEAGADKTQKDSQRDTALSWASWHCRPASVLKLLSYGEHCIHESHVKNMISDHGHGWGGGMSLMRIGRVHLK